MVVPPTHKAVNPPVKDGVEGVVQLRVAVPERTNFVAPNSTLRLPSADATTITYKGCPALTAAEKLKAVGPLTPAAIPFEPLPLAMVVTPEAKVELVEQKIPKISL